MRRGQMAETGGMHHTLVILPSPSNLLSAVRGPEIPITLVSSSAMWQADNNGDAGAMLSWHSRVFVPNLSPSPHLPPHRHPPSREKPSLSFLPQKMPLILPAPSLNQGCVEHIIRERGVFFLKDAGLSYSVNSIPLTKENQCD